MEQIRNEPSEKEEPVRRNYFTIGQRVLGAGLIAASIATGYLGLNQLHSWNSQLEQLQQPPERIARFYSDSFLLERTCFTGTQVLDSSTREECLRIKQRYDEAQTDASFLTEKKDYEEKRDAMQGYVDKWSDPVIMETLFGAPVLFAVGVYIVTLPRRKSGAKNGQ
jgi:hypothetical protein